MKDGQFGRYAKDFTMTTLVELQEHGGVEQFYNGLAADYDVMTGFSKRFIKEKPFFRLLVEKFKIHTALDVGCGTGFHALLLAQLGVRVKAIDRSQGMLVRAKQHAQELTLSIDFRKASLETPMPHRQFDAIFCLGNTLPHLLTREELKAAILNFSLALGPRKVLFVQNLNYDRILAHQERVQSIKEVNGKTYVRFYDYIGEKIVFNILTIEKVRSALEQHLQSVELRPLRQAELTSILQKAGFDDIKSYGSISMDEFHPETSKDLVLLARKSN